MAGRALCGSCGIVLCSQQRRKVTISLAEEVRKRHGMVGQAVVGFHVSKNRSAGPASRLMYMTEAIGVYALINNRDLACTASDHCGSGRGA